MQNNDEGLIVCNSNKRFVRVGASNFWIFIGVVFSIMLNLLFIEIGLEDYYIRIIIVTFFIFLIIKIYLHSIARIFIRNKEKLVIVGPLSETEIKLSEVVCITISGARSRFFVGIEIKLKNKKFPRIYHFSVVHTNYGFYKDTKSGLVNYLMKYGDTIPVYWHDI